MDSIWVGFIWEPLAFATDDGYEGEWEVTAFFETFEEADAWQKMSAPQQRKLELVQRYVENSEGEIWLGFIWDAGSDEGWVISVAFLTREEAEKWKAAGPPTKRHILSVPYAKS